jgi:ABC-type Fe3+/spermidine/putrescine transport system ATPase subunit
MGDGALIFRPQAVLVNPHSMPGGAAISLDGLVIAREFLGSTVRYQVQVGKEVIQTEENHLRGKHVLAEGDQVRLAIEPDQLLFVHD